MKRVLAVTVFGVMSLAVAAPLGAGDKKTEGPARGPEHKFLESLAGKYDAKVKLYFPDPSKPTESTGTMTRKMILDGNILRESFKGEFAGKPFEGVGMVGFDLTKKEFTSTWADSMSTSITIMRCTWDADKKTFTSVGEEIEPKSKKMMKMRDVLKIVSADEQTFEMHRLPEGETKELKILEITYKRAPAKKKAENK
jgi:Protein of unknown function (DUF1579)